MDRSPRQKINTKIVDLKYALGHTDLTDIYATFYPMAAECAFFLGTHGTFSRIDHMLGHKTSLNKFKKTEIISSNFSDDNSMKLQINNRKTGKFTNMWKLKQYSPELPMSQRRNDKMS